MIRGVAPWESGSRSVPASRRAGLDQGVPEPGAGLAGVPAVVGAVARPRSRGWTGSRRGSRRRRPGCCGGGLGCGQREQHGLHPGGVLDGPAAGEPDPAEAVLAQAQEPAVVRGPLLAVEGLFVTPVGAVRVEALQDPAAGRARSVASEPAGLLQQQPFRGGAQPGVDRQPVHRGHHHFGLRPGDPARPQVPAPVAVRSPVSAWARRVSRLPAPLRHRSPRSRSPWSRPTPRSWPPRWRRCRRPPRADRVEHRPQLLHRPHHREQHLGRTDAPARPGHPREDVGHRLHRPDRRARISEARGVPLRQPRQVAQVGEVHGVRHTRDTSRHHRQKQTLV